MKTAAIRRSPPTALAIDPQPPVTIGIAAAIYSALALFYFLPAFLPGRHIFGTDYLVGGFFAHEFISARFAAGEVPKWVPYLYGGVPLFANPGSTFYPARFFADLLFPVSWIFPTIFVIQFALAGLGMFLLTRELGARGWVALVTGLAWQFTGILTSWVYAGHDGRIIVASLTPMFFYFLHGAVRTGRFAWFVGMAATLGFALLSFQIQVAYYMLLAGAIWTVFCMVHLGVASRPAVLGKLVALGLGAVVAGFALASVNFLPFLDYVGASPRGEAGGRGWEFSTSFSMPWAGLVSTAVPEQQGASVQDPQAGTMPMPVYQGRFFKLHSEYLGALALIGLALGAVFVRRNRYWWFFAGLGLFFLTLALGSHTPLYRLYYEVLPGIKRFRAPDLAYFVLAFAVVTMAGLALERVAALRDEAAGPRGTAAETSLARVPWVVLVIAGLALASAVLFGAQAGGAATPPPADTSAAAGWMRFALFAAAVGGVLWLWTSRRLATGVMVVLLSVVTLADLWIIGKRFFYTVDSPDVEFAPDDVANFLRMQPDQFRVWVLPFPPGAVYRGQPDNYLMRFQIDQAGGEHGNQLQRWNEYVGAGEDTYVDWHNFVTEAGVVETAAGRALAFQSAPGFLEAANIRYIISMVPLAHPALREVHRGSALIYEHVQSLPRAYVVPEAIPVAEERMLEAMLTQPWDPQRTAFVLDSAAPALPISPLEAEAQVVEYTPDRVVVRTRATRPALLVLADNFYPGWEARVNGEPVPVLRTNHTLRGVPVGAGEQEVVFTFVPSDLYVGLIIYVVGMALLVLYASYLLYGHLRRQRRNGESKASV